MPTTPFRALASALLMAWAVGLAGCTSPTRKSAPEASAASLAERNQQIVLAFYRQFFGQRDLSAAERYITPDYIQHNPMVPSGREAFVNAFRNIFAQRPQRSSTIHRVIAEGDLVVVHVHSRSHPQDRGSAIIDIFRVNADGQIAEHWDVIQPVPEQSANDNTMF